MILSEAPDMARAPLSFVSLERERVLRPDMICVKTEEHHHAHEPVV